MRRSLALVMIGLLLTPLVCAAGDDTPETRRMAAKRYVALISTEKQASTIFTRLSLQVPAEQREDFIAYMHDTISVDRVEEIMVAVMAANFTTEELTALADFYSSPVGRSIQKKWNHAMTESQNLFLKEVSEALKARQQDRSGQ